MERRVNEMERMDNAFSIHCKWGYIFIQLCLETKNNNVLYINGDVHHNHITYAVQHCSEAKFRERLSPEVNCELSY